MRALAIARFRLWTTIRVGNPYVVFAAGAPAIAAVVQVAVASSGDFSPDAVLHVSATAALFAWTLHSALMFGVTQEMGNAAGSPLDTPVHQSDLMDSAPIRSDERTAGELAGVLVSASLIHVCCLPLLAITAALSPLPGPLAQHVFR